MRVQLSVAIMALLAVSAVESRSDDMSDRHKGAAPFAMSSRSNDTGESSSGASQQIGIGSVIEPVDFVFYTSSVGFHNVTSMITTRLEKDGWKCARVLGSSDPSEAKAVFQAYYEAAVDQDYGRPPMCVVVGEANQGDRPQCNVVGTFYVEDEQDQCYWDSCASDLEFTNFYGNGPEAPYSRVVACTIWELDRIIRSTLEYYDNINVSDERVLAIVGDLTPWCNPADRHRLLIDEVRGWYTDHGFPIVQHNESSYSCYDYTSRHAVFCSEINVGVTEIIGTGRLTHRNALPGFFCQTLSRPVFRMEHLPTRQRIICQLFAAGVADTDRINTRHYPAIAKMFLTAEPNSGTSAVAWLGHSRGGYESLHLFLASEYFRKRLGSKPHQMVQKVHWLTVRRLWEFQPAMRPFLRMAMALGFPVPYPRGLPPPPDPDQLPDGPAISLVGVPSPGREVSLRYRIPTISRVRLAVYDVSGRKVRTLITPDLFRAAGTHTIAWDGRVDDGVRVAAGLYFARLDVEGRSAVVRKIVLLQ